MACSTDNETYKCPNFVIKNNILIGATDTINTDRKVGPLILDIFTENPNHVAQIDSETGRQTTYAEMKDHSIRCALWLKKLGIGPNDFIIACTHNHLDSYIPLIATFFVDAIFNGWKYNITIDNARSYMKQFMPKVIFTCEKAVDVLQEASKLEKIDVEFVVFGEHPSLTTLTKIMNNQTKEEIDNFTVTNLKSPKDVAVVVFSSGSSGFPKGVMKSNEIIMSTLLKLHKFTDTTSRFMWHSMLDWMTGISYLLQTIMKNQTRIIPTYRDVEKFLQIIEKYKVNRVSFPVNFPLYIAKFHLLQKYDLKSLDTIILAGWKHSNEVIQYFRQNIPTALIYKIYGSTEIGIAFETTPACKNVESVGFITTNVQAKFVDLDTGKSVGPNHHGEICIKSSTIMIGYFNNPEATKEAFDEDGWFHTGDIGYYDESGEIFYIDRMKGLIKYKNHRISPIQIEEILLLHPDVYDAVVVALPHEIDGNWPLAFCKKAPKSNVTEEDLLKLTSVLEDYKRLRGGIHFLDNFRYTTSGKIARYEMKLFATKFIKKKSES